jgi:hypothetical protein
MSWRVMTFCFEDACDITDRSDIACGHVSQKPVPLRQVRLWPVWLNDSSH